MTARGTPVQPTLPKKEVLRVPGLFLLPVRLDRAFEARELTRSEKRFSFAHLVTNQLDSVIERDRADLGVPLVTSLDVGNSQHGKRLSDRPRAEAVVVGDGSFGVVGADDRLGRQDYVVVLVELDDALHEREGDELVVDRKIGEFESVLVRLGKGVLHDDAPR